MDLRINRGASSDKKTKNDQSDEQKRAHHNALEKKRRLNMKETYACLRETIPSLQTEEVVSCAKILKEATHFIGKLSNKNSTSERSINDLKQQNESLNFQVKILENMKAENITSKLS